MPKTATEMEKALCELLDAIASDGRIDAATREAMRRSESGDMLYYIRWQDNTFRWFHELAPIARRIGRVKRLQHMQGVTVNDETVYTLDPALLARFGFPDEPGAREMAELHGFKHFPYALDADGNRIPLLSTRHPRPQRPHRPPSEHRRAPNPNELPKWHRDYRPPAAPSVPVATYVGNALSDYVKANAPKPERADITALREQAALLKERGRAQPRPIDRAGRPTMVARIQTPRADDPPERTTGARQ